MLAAVRNRLCIIGARLGHSELIRQTTWGDVFHETFKWYGRHKREIDRRMKCIPDGELLRVELDGRVIYWPLRVDPSRLVDMYFEVFEPGNNHYFNTEQTSVSRGDVVLDCGACEGYFTLQALEQGAERVYSMEPGNAISRCLARTFAEPRRQGRVSLHQCLLGERSAEVLFYENLADPTVCRMCDDEGQTEPGRAGVRTLEMTTLDDFCRRERLEKLDFIKADIEGGEVGLLRGAEQTLRKFRPKLALAAYHNPDDATRMVDFVDALGLGYRFRVKGILNSDRTPRPVMVHCY
jgi:FkbM family methyltransferase